VSKNIEDYESCPHCSGSFSFSRPSHHSGKCPWCKRNVLPIIPPPPTPQQPTEASPSAEAMEAAGGLLHLLSEHGMLVDFWIDDDLPLVARFLDAHFAREFARRVEEAIVPAFVYDVQLHEGYIIPIGPGFPGNDTHVLTKGPGGFHAGLNVAFREGWNAALRALGGEGGKR
jgi:hypothetical protein